VTVKLRRKFLFCWTNESLYRAAFDHVLSDPTTRSLRWLGGGRLADNIFISARYGDFLLRTARDEPASQRSMDLFRTYSYLETKVIEQWLATWSKVDYSETLLLTVREIEWIVNDGVPIIVPTILATLSANIVVGFVDELGAVGQPFAIDRLLIETERRHLA
jgi:hypothetical protein